MKKILFIAIVFLSTSFFAFGANAQGKPFDPLQKCSEFFVKESAINKVIVGLWANGYIAGISGEVKQVDAKVNDDLMKNLKSLCKQYSEENLANIVKQYMKNQNLNPDNSNTK